MPPIAFVRRRQFNGWAAGPITILKYNPCYIIRFFISAHWVDGLWTSSDCILCYILWFSIYIFYIIWFFIQYTGFMAYKPAVTAPCAILSTTGKSPAAGPQLTRDDHLASVEDPEIRTNFCKTIIHPRIICLEITDGEIEKFSNKISWILRCWIFWRGINPDKGFVSFFFVPSCSVWISSVWRPAQDLYGVSKGCPDLCQLWWSLCSPLGFGTCTEK